MKKLLVEFGIIQIISIQTYALCTFTFSLQTFTIFFLINAFINVYYNSFDVYHIYVISCIRPYVYLWFAAASLATLPAHGTLTQRWHCRSGLLIKIPKK